MLNQIAWTGRHYFSQTLFFYLVIALVAIGEIWSSNFSKSVFFKKSTSFELRNLHKFYYNYNVKEKFFGVMFDLSTLPLTYVLFLPLNQWHGT